MRLVGLLGFVAAYPAPDHFSCTADRFEAMLPDTFLYHAAYEALQRAVLLGAVQRDEFLLWAITPDRGGMIGHSDEIDRSFRRS